MILDHVFAWFGRFFCMSFCIATPEVIEAVVFFNELRNNPRIERKEKFHHHHNKLWIFKPSLSFITI